MTDTLLEQTRGEFILPNANICTESGSSLTSLNHASHSLPLPTLPPIHTL